MELRLLEFAQYAAAAADGSLTIAGIFNGAEVVVGPPPAPGVRTMIALPKCSLVFVLTCGVHEGTEHRVTLLIQDEDGHDVAGAVEMPARFVINREGRPMRFQGIANIPMLPLPRPGDYVAHLEVDGTRLGSVDLYISPARQP